MPGYKIEGRSVCVSCAVCARNLYITRPRDKHGTYAPEGTLTGLETRTVTRALISVGWTYTNNLRKCYCIDCTPKRKAKMGTNVNKGPLLGSAIPIPVRPPEPLPEIPAQSPAEVAVEINHMQQVGPTTIITPQLRRAIISSINVHFDVDKGRYRLAISDASIAKENGVTPGIVRELREMFYGGSDTNEAAETVYKAYMGLEDRLKAVEILATNQFEAVLKKIDQIRADLNILKG